MNNSSTQIALLGTSADPPTYGHLALLEELLKIFPKVVTWASDNTMKSHGASLQKRHNLLNALVTEIADPRLELLQELSSPWTIKTLERAEILWPSNELIFIIGSDLLAQIPTWASAEVLLTKARIGIVPRQGWPLKIEHLNKIKSLGGEIEVLPVNIPNTASSKVRSQTKLEQIPSSILPMLLKDNLYGLKDNLR